MRVSSTQAMARYIKQLNVSYDKQTALFEQANGSNLHRSSDGSVRYSKYLRYESAATENEQYQDNVKTAISWMKSADAAMVSMKDILETLKEKTIQAANDTNGETDLQAIAKDFKAKLQEVIALGNSQSGDSYLFAGQSDLKQPFTMLNEKQMCAVAKTLSDSQATFFAGEADNSGGNLPQLLALEGSDGSTYYLSTTSMSIYSEDLVNSGYKKTDENGLARGVSSADSAAKLTLTEFSISDYFSSSGVMKVAPAGSLYRKETAVTTDSDGNTIATIVTTTDSGGKVTYKVTDSSGKTYKATASPGTDGSTVYEYQNEAGIKITITKQSNGSTVLTSDSADSESWFKSVYSGAKGLDVSESTDGSNKIYTVGKDTDGDGVIDGAVSSDASSADKKSYFGPYIFTVAADGNCTMTTADGIEYECGRSVGGEPRRNYFVTTNQPLSSVIV